MTRTADVVVVGAGIIGSSIAFQLARHGAGSVAVVDKGRGPAEGSTGASSSICRCRYTHPEVVRLALHGQEAYGHWAEFTGLDDPRSGLERIGVLWMMGETTEKVGLDVDKLVGEGVKAEALDPGLLAGMYPALSDCGAPFDLTGEVEHVCSPGEAFLFEPEGGYADPVGANQDLIDAARGAGADVHFDSQVVGVLGNDYRVSGVRLGDGTEIHAGLVVNAAGPWCNQLNALAGADLRWTLTPTRIQTVYRSWPSEQGPIPVTADGSTGIYFRPDSGGRRVLVGSVLAEDEEEIVVDPDRFHRGVDPDFATLKLAAFHHRVPGLEARGDISGLAGLYTINREDVHPVVGPSGVEGFWVANGFSGHGFKLAPAIGSMLAQTVTGVSMEFDTDVPMSFFAVDREPIESPGEARARLMRYLNSTDTRQALPMADAVKSMQHAFSGEAEAPLRSMVGKSLVMPGSLDGVMAVKVVSTVPGNPAGIVAVFGPDGNPIGFVHGPTLTAIRTGAVCGLATAMLAPPDITTMTLLGAGAMAVDQVAAIRAVRDVERVLVWSRNRSNARLVADIVGGEVAEDPDQAVAAADVVRCATPATTPLFSDSAVSGETHVNAIGAFTPEMAEVPPALLHRAYVVVDDVEAAAAEAGDLIQAGRSPDTTLRDLLADVAPPIEREVTVFKSVGVAAQDVAAAHAALMNADHLGIGTLLPT